MSTASLVTRRRFSLLACLFVASAMLTSGACNSTKEGYHAPPKEASQARCTESHSADGSCDVAVADEE